MATLSLSHVWDILFLTLKNRNDGEFCWEKFKIDPNWFMRYFSYATNKYSGAELY